MTTSRGSFPAVWGGVPQRIRNFTGRTDVLAQLRTGTAGNAAVVLPHALQGLGGVGKTAVAIEYAHLFRSDYDLVWWIPADQAALVRSSLARLAEQLGLPAATATGIESAAAAALDALRRGEPYSRWLLIFDNADQPEDLNDIIPRDGPGNVLITSRNHRWQSVIDTVSLDVFDRAESIEFLKKRVPKGLAESSADRLAEILGDLPLALEQAGALQAETGMPVEEYLRLLDRQVTEMLGLGTSPDYPLSMSAAWKLSVTTLRKQMPEAQELLRCCAFFGPDPIPRDVFRWGTQATETRVRELIADPIRLSTAIRELARFALIKIDGRTISVHRLIQALIRDELDLDEQGVYRHEVHLILTAAAPQSSSDKERWGRYAELLAHVTSPATRLPGCRDRAVRSFALDMMRYLYLRGDFSTCRSVAERFIAQWIKDSAPADDQVLDAQRHLGNALRGGGLYTEAYHVIEDTLNSAEETLGPLDELTLALRNSFGADLWARGEFGQALSLHEEARTLHEQRFGETHPQTLRVMNNLGVDYALTSRHYAARDIHKKVLTLQSEATEGVSTTEVLISWNNLARALRLCGEYSQARDVGEDAYEYGRAELGSTHYLTLRAINDLSIAERRVAKDFDKSLALAEEAFTQFVHQFGERNPDTMAAAISLVNIQRTMGQIAQAAELAEITVARYPQIYGPSHPYYFGCTGNLAVLRRLAGDAGEASKLDEIALSRLDALLGRDHFYSLTLATNLASDLASLGDTAGARALGEDTLARCREVLRADHPVTLGCAANLAIDLQTEHADEEARQLRSDTMRRYARTLGLDHPDAQVAAAGQRLDFDFDPPPI
jgi:hypothetical protein